MNPGLCRTCHTLLRGQGPARGGRCACPQCSKTNRYPRPSLGAPSHRMVPWNIQLI